MCSTKWLDATYYAELIGFVLSLSLHSILLKLISEKPKSTFGNYKYLMMSFSALGIFYSCCNFWSKPNVHITNTSFIVFTILKYSKVSKEFGSIAVTIYCSCYAMMLSLLSIHFFYRYTSVTAPMLLPTRFSKHSVFVWSLYVLIFSSIWGCSSYFLCGPTENKDLELSTEFQRTYCLYPTEYAYVGPQYFYETWKNGTEKVENFHFPSFIGISILASQMGGTFICVSFFGFFTYKELNDLGITCFASKELQKQLFRTLVIQTIIPSIFMYFPVSCMFLFPIFGVKIEAMANLIPISVAIYPCLEPMVAMVCINDFRLRILDIVTCSRNRRFRVHTIPHSYADSSRVYSMNELSIR